MMTSRASPTSMTAVVRSSTPQGESSELTRVHSWVSGALHFLPTSTMPARAASLSAAGTPSSRLASRTSTWPAISGTLATILALDAGKKWIIRDGRTGISRSGVGAPTASGRKKSLGERIGVTLTRRCVHQPGPLAAGDHLGRHLPRGLVHHLVAEADRPSPLVAGGGIQGVQDGGRVVELRLRGRERLVDDRDLVGVDGPLAVDAQRPGPPAVVPQPVEVADPQVGAVHDLQAVGPAGGEDPGEGVVEVVAGVLGDLYAGGEHRHVHRGGEVGRPEHHRLPPWGGGAG